MGRTAIFGLMLVLVAGCMPSYELGARPLPPLPRNEAERCYQRERLDVASGSASWNYTDSIATGATTTYRTHHFSAGGLTFFRGGERLTPKEALDLLGDEELRAEYQRKLSETSASHTMYPVWRNSALLMATGGLALTGVALGQVLSWSHEERVANGLPKLMWVGAGLGVLSVVPTALASVTYENAIRHDRARTLFDEQNLLPRLAQGVQRFNLQAAERCGFSPEPATAGPRSSQLP
jgi:hypothetical protein